MSDQYGYVDDDREDEDDPCDHDDYDTDLINGRNQCWRCGHIWYSTAEQIDAELRRQSEYGEEMEREYRREWWRTLPARTFDRVASIFRRPKPLPPDDDGIPF